MKLRLNDLRTRFLFIYIALFSLPISIFSESHNYDVGRNVQKRQSGNITDGSSFTAITGHGFIGIDWERVSSPCIICLWVVFAGMSKISLQLIPKLVSRVPESCILICVGLAVGGMAYTISSTSELSSSFFQTDAFFLYILPPIVMEAGYFMPKRFFFANAGTILLYAFVGTIFNAMATGGALYAVYGAGLMPGISELNLLHCLLFGSIISAVDPVAVISVFEEIHVNNNLYICVFGESLLNDGVVVVLYNLLDKFLILGAENITGLHILYAFASFLLVVFGALFIGIFFGYLCAFITKYTVNNRIFEPTFVFAFCYVSYLSAEIFHLSGIIAAVVSAFTMSSYVEQNISTKSHTTVKYALKMMANVAETVIFMVLGIATVSDFWTAWNTGFVLWTLLFCLGFRVISVYALTALANPFRLDKINKVDQFVMAYGGLRGAIAFSLVSLVNYSRVPAKETMICACIVIILFTSFVQGATVRPIVELLNVKIADAKHSKTMFEEITSRLIDHLMAGVEDVIGHHGHYYWMQRLHEMHNKYVGKIFVRTPFKTRNEKLFEIFHKINKRDAEDLVSEFEKGSSTDELRQVLTFTSFMLPLEVRKTLSASTVEMRDNKPEGTVDINKDYHGDKQPVITHEADIHHLLQHNMYQPRRIERNFYRRGFLEDDGSRNQQEDEILLRHKMSLSKKRHHHKHYRHSKKKINSYKTPSFRRMKTNVSDPSFALHHPILLEEGPEDVGINFTVEDKRSVSRGPLSFLNIFEDVKEKRSDKALDTTSSVAIDRELPWKQTSHQPITDPHSTDQLSERKSESERELQEKRNRNPIE